MEIRKRCIQNSLLPAGVSGAHWNGGSKVHQRPKGKKLMVHFWTVI